MHAEDLQGRDSSLSEGTYIRPFPFRYARFASFQIDFHSQRLTSNSFRIRIPDKAYQILLALLEKPLDIVTREELRRRLWPAHAQVNAKLSRNINTVVNKLRQARSAFPGGEALIETYPRRSYALSVQPEFSDHPFAMAEVVAPKAPQAGKSHTLDKRILVAVGLLIGSVCAAMIMRWILRFVPIHL